LFDIQDIANFFRDISPQLNTFDLLMVNTDLAFPKTGEKTGYTVNLYVSPTAAWTCITWGSVDSALGAIGGFAAMVGLWAITLNSFYSEFKLQKMQARHLVRFEKIDSIDDFVDLKKNKVTPNTNEANTLEEKMQTKDSCINSEAEVDFENKDDDLLTKIKQYETMDITYCQYLRGKLCCGRCFKKDWLKV
jgi:hypothetical protein